MVDFNHEAILSRGVESWNNWRQESPDIVPDLEGSRGFFGGCLSGVMDPELPPCPLDLRGINFSNTLLRGNYLGWADLRDANLQGADLTRADLINANLIGAKLSNAILYRARLVNALLVSADFSHTELKGADFSNVIFRVEDLAKMSDLMRKRFYCDYSMDDRALKLVHPQLSQRSRVNFSHSNLHFARLRDVCLQGARLEGADLSGANLQRFDFRNAILREVNFTGANLTSADLHGADLKGADLKRVILDGANMESVNICEADFSDASLENANLTRTIAVGTIFRRSRLSGTYIYGIAAWSIDLEGAIQHDLIITQPGEPTITVDSLEVAQFVYLLLQNDKVRDVIDTIGRKAILILGRFTVERKQLLDAIKSAFRSRGYLPIMFDFDKPSSRDNIETLSILAHMSRFVVADLTDAKSVLQELQRIVPSLPSVPIMPILAHSDNEPGMFDHFRQFRSVLPIRRYESLVDLLESLDEFVIGPAQAYFEETHKH